MKFTLFIPGIFAFNGFDTELASSKLCDWNYEACINGDTSMGADCLMNPELGSDLLCTEQCFDHFETLGGEKLINYESFCGFRSNCPPGGCVSSFNIDKIKQYGCWCNFDDRLTEGSGEPINEYDSVCRNFQLCLRCTRIDAKNGDYSCDPKTDTYGAEGNSAFSIDCSAANAGNLCGESLCSCNQNFLQRIFLLNWIIPSLYTPEFLHSRGFNHELECPYVGGHREVECCGYWPDRFPYSTSSGRSCCNQHTIYNPVDEVCCENGTVAHLGQLCE